MSGKRFVLRFYHCQNYNDKEDRSEEKNRHNEILIKFLIRIVVSLVIKPTTENPTGVFPSEQNTCRDPEG